MYQILFFKILYYISFDSNEFLNETIFLIVALLDYTKHTDSPFLIFFLQLVVSENVCFSYFYL